MQYNYNKSIKKISKKQPYCDIIYKIILEDSMKNIRLCFILLAVSLFTACMPYMTSSLNSRQHLRVDKYWLGYGAKGPLLSNRLQSVCAIDEQGKKDEQGNPLYSIYLATLKGLQVSYDEGNNWEPLTWGKNDGTDAGSPITGVADIFNDVAHSRILISSSCGFFYKFYNNKEVFKVESTSAYPLKQVDLTDPNFREPALQRRTQEDVDGYQIAVAGDHIYLASSTGLYFSTDFDTTTPAAANAANWGNIIGKTIITMRDKHQDYPITKIPGTFKKFNPDTRKMDIFHNDRFYTGYEAWAISEVNYDPIYDPVLNPIYNKNPDFYAWEDNSNYKDKNGVSYSFKKGEPISWEIFCYTKGDGAVPYHFEKDDFNKLSSADQAEQRASRYHYETVVEKSDRGNPNNETSGVVRGYAYYRDFRLKATRINGVSIYNGIVHLATQGSGVAYATIPANLDSGDPSTYSSSFIWETYTKNYFHYPSIQNPVAQRSEENFWSLSDIRGLCISADEKGIFYGAMDGGIHLAPTYKSIRTVRDVYGLASDNNGNTECILTEKGNFQYFNQFYYPELAKAFPDYTSVQRADLYFREDRDAQDGIPNDNLIQGLRLNWQEYTTRGWSVYVAQGDTPPYQSPDYKFPNNTIRKIRFGSIENMQLIYIATNNGMGVAEIRKKYAKNNGLKIPATVTGDEQYSIEFADWGKYHKDPTQLVEQNFVNDFSITKDKNGNDHYIYCATDGQGLVRFYWKQFDQKPHNLDPNVLGK